MQSTAAAIGGGRVSRVGRQLLEPSAGMIEDGESLEGFAFVPECRHTVRSCQLDASSPVVVCSVGEMSPALGRRSQFRLRASRW